jgi:ferredoxin
MTAPEAFEVDEDAALARVLPGAATTEPDLLQQAVYVCPTQAISLETEA